jgi:hypothetical protein
MAMDIIILCISALRIGIQDCGLDPIGLSKADHLEPSIDNSHGRAAHHPLRDAIDNGSPTTVAEGGKIPAWGAEV